MKTYSVYLDSTILAGTYDNIEMAEAYFDTAVSLVENGEFEEVCLVDDETNQVIDRF